MTINSFEPNDSRKLMSVAVTVTAPASVKSPAIGTACAVVGRIARLTTASAEKIAFFKFGLLKIMTLILPVRPRALHQPSTQAKLSRFDAQSNIDQFVIFINAVTGCA